MTDPVYDAFLTTRPEDLDYLRRRDKRLCAAIDTIGPLSRPVITDVFKALVHTVAGQQISSRVHAIISRRLFERLGPLTPDKLLATPEDTLRDCGLSRVKTACVRRLAVAAVNGELDLSALPAMDDEAVRQHLLHIKGLGPWSVEMILIFCLRRPDVLSFGDFGIRRGLRMLYGKKEITPEFFDNIRSRYAPRGSTASLYLWELASGNYPDYPDPAGTGMRSGTKKDTGAKPDQRG